MALHLATAHPRIAADPPARCLALPLAAGPARWYWGDGDGLRVLGWGAAVRAEAQGPDRFERLAACQAQALWETVVAPPGSALAAAELPWFLGFGFWDGPSWPDFPAALLTLPATGLVLRPGQEPVLFVLDGDPAAAAAAAAAAAERLAGWDGGTDAPPPASPAILGPPPADLEARIASVVRAIQVGEARKAVLAGARTARRADGGDWIPLTLLERRMRAEPGAFHFLLSPSPGRAWIGASPERLAAVRDGRLWTMALAGSRPRGADPVADAALGRDLLASAKEGVEHRLVVEAIVADLAALGLEVAAEGPRLRRLSSLQHLETLLTGPLPPGTALLDIVKALHPTPALGGRPTAAALHLIARHEALPDGRGWYGGGLGWLDGRGEGDVSVGIRGLLVRGPLATVYAGAGLVADSDPPSEAAEIAVKMAAALSALDPADL